MHTHLLLTLLTCAAIAINAVAANHADTTALNTTLNEIIIEGTPRGNFLSGSAIDKREIISSRGLTKLACCTLAESFENSAAVSVGYDDAVSGTRQIRMLGLKGSYTQMLDESRPFMGGLSAPFALNYTPGAWLKSIQVSKGVASVTAGHEAITGQINLEYRKPTDDERLFANVYFDDMLRPEVNLCSALPLTADKSLSTIVLMHGSIDTDLRGNRSMDCNRDGFRDLPRSQQIDVANRWVYLAPSGMQLRWGGRFTADNRLGGAMHYRHSERSAQQTLWPFTDTPLPDNNYNFGYGTRSVNHDAGLYVKIGIPTRGNDNIALLADASHFDTRNYYGLNDYNAHENAANISLRYDCHLSLVVTLCAGTSLHTRRINETVVNRTLTHGSRYIDLTRNDREAGAYTELTIDLPERLTLVAGLRADRHFAPQRQWLFTPRTHLKWHITARTTLRLSAGSGHRLPAPVSENLGILATGRQLIIVTDKNPHSTLSSALAMERALTAGGSITQTFTLGRDHNASISADYFFTDLRHSTIVDTERNLNQIWVYGLHGGNRSHTWQIDFNWQPFARFDVLATARFTHSKLTLPRPDGTTFTDERPLTSRFKALLSLSYATRFRRWVFDATIQLNGPARVPQTAVSNAFHSPTYAQLMAQITHKVGRADLYLGCENITDYRQQHTIDAPDQPFCTNFNTINVWGPLMPRRIYVGLRLNIY